MHTREDGGADVELLTGLESQWTFEADPSATTQPATPDAISLDEIERAFNQLTFDSPEGLSNVDVDVAQVYPFEEPERVQKGQAPQPKSDDVAAHDGGAGSSTQWKRGHIYKKLELK